MLKNLENKKRLVADIASLLDKEKPSTVVIDYTDISSNEMNDLRSRLFEKNATLKIIKNTLIERVLSTVGVNVKKEKNGTLTGQNALLIAKEDLVGTIKDLYDFIKETEKGVVKFAVLDGEVLDSSKVKALSKLPSKQELLGQVVSGFMSPLRSFAYALNDTQSKFVRVLSAIKNSKQE